jgi:hypothetical protein
MNSDIKMSVQVGLLYMIKRTRLIGYVIIAGVFIIYAVGVLMRQAAAEKEYEYLNIAAFGFCVIACAVSVMIRNKMMAKVNAKNYQSTYFAANILPFALCDAGGIICITMNLFINWNMIYATAGLLVMVIALVYNFPKETESDAIAERRV